MVDATERPVTAKIRIGWDNQNINGVKVSQLIENSGAQAVCIHGRTADQQYAGKVNWTIMKQVKEKVHIPVIAKALENYKGAMILVSHVPDFVKQIKIDHVLDRALDARPDVGVEQGLLEFVPGLADLLRVHRHGVPLDDRLGLRVPSGLPRRLGAALRARVPAQCQGGGTRRLHLRLQR
jgi:hypothetical protein